MAKVFQPATHVEQHFRDQQRTILNLQDSIRQLHMENAVLRQCVLEHQQKLHSNHMITLSSKLKDYYSKKVNRKVFDAAVLSPRDMVLVLEEIVMSVEHSEEMRMEYKQRSLSPAFTFAEEKSSADLKFHLKLDSVDSAQTNTSDSNSIGRSSKESKYSSGDFGSSKVKRSKTEKSKFGFLSLFKRKSDASVKFK